MIEPPAEETVLQKLTAWGEARDFIRALILTSTRANPNAHLDRFSDYDLIVVVREVRPLYEDDSWLEDFGPVMVVYRDPLQLEYGWERFARITLYQDATKIDYSILPVELLLSIAGEPHLRPDLDNGYRVLLDKDGLTAGLQPPTYQAFIPQPPSETTYRELVEEFFSESTYVAKNIWRDEIIFWKYNLDKVMKGEVLLQMLQWRMEIDHQWSVRLGKMGKGLKTSLPEAWAALERTYTGPDPEENWQALFQTITLFRQVAQEVADRLGYTYPREVDERVMAYLTSVKALERQKPGAAKKVSAP